MSMNAMIYGKGVSQKEYCVDMCKNRLSVDFHEAFLGFRLSSSKKDIVEGGIMQLEPVDYYIAAVLKCSGHPVALVFEHLLIQKTIKRIPLTETSESYSKEEDELTLATNQRKKCVSFRLRLRIVFRSH